MTSSHANGCPWLAFAIAALGITLTLQACSFEAHTFPTCQSPSQCGGNDGSTSSGTGASPSSAGSGNGGTPGAAGAVGTPSGGAPTGEPSGTAGGGAGAKSVVGTGGAGATVGGSGSNTAGGAMGTSAGSSGTGAAGSFGCSGVLTGPLITEFADVTPSGTGSFAFTLGVPGGTYAYQTGLLTVTTPGMALNVKGNVNTYAGFGLYFNQCEDASAYTGISFSIKGNAGSIGTLNFRVGTNSNTAVDQLNMKGACVVPAGTTETYSLCHASAVDIPVTAAGAVVTVQFNELQGGAPVSSVTAKDILSLEWAFNWTPAGTAFDVDVTLDDVKFISGTGGSAGAGAGGAGTH